MDFSIKPYDAKNALVTAKSGCIVVGIFENGQLSEAAAALNGHGAISSAFKSGDLSGKPGSTLLLRHPEGISAARVLLAGLGPQDKFNDKAFGKVAQAALKQLATLGAADAILALPFASIKGRDPHWAIRACVLAGFDAMFRRDTLKSKPEKIKGGPKKIALAVAADAGAKKALATAIATAHGIDLCKQLANLPGNVCTPSHLAQTAQQLAKDYGFDAEILERKQIEALKMCCFLSVARGSDEPPRFIVLKHMGGKPKEAPFVLVGKGITFDSGGISLKDGVGMDEMKFDMGGAAAVIGTMRAVGELKLKRNVVALIPSCENLPSGRASKPGDVVTSMAGLTVEILNTDAEGRLILCDALAYAEHFQPAAVIDVATLTGACVTALGHHHSGLFARDDEPGNALAEALTEAGRDTGDTAWRLPLDEAYQEQLKSNFADIANIGSPGGGSSVGAAFLEYFTRSYPWAHLDIAGTAWKSGAAKGATGRPVALLVRYLTHAG